MSEEFKITGPGAYRQRNGKICKVAKYEILYPWTDGDLLWTNDGKYCIGSTDPRDLVARVEEPQPDVQDGVLGVEPAKPLDPLARLDAWVSDDPLMRRANINARRVTLECGMVTITVLDDATDKALTKALDIAEGIR